MKARDELRKGTLRMLLAAVMTAEVAGTEARELSDQDVLGVLGKEAKKRAEAAAVFTDAGRDELAAKEIAEAEIIKEYLPTPLTDTEVEAIASTAIAQVSTELGAAPTMRQMGQVMKIATALAKGQADGSRLSTAVKAKL